MKGFLSVIVFIALVAFALGASVSGAALVAVSPKPSQEVVDQIEKEKAKEEAETKAAWRETWTGVARVFEYGIAGTFLSGIVIAGTVVVGRWIKRHDRNPDEAGRYPLVPSSAKLTNANTGLALNEPMPAEVMLKLAAMQRDVNMTWGAFSNGINGRQASDRQRDLRPAPPGWDGTIEMPEEDRTIGLEGFMLVDESGNQQQLSAGRGPEVAGVPATENMTWR